MSKSARYVGACAHLVAALSIVATVGLAAPTAAQGVRDEATQISNDDIAAAIQKMGSRPVGEQQLRIVSVNDEYNIGIGVVHHVKPQGDGKPFVVEHSEITEILYFISGHGTLISGGSIKDAKEVSPDSEMASVLSGPSASGSEIVGGERHLIEPGDVVIIPPNTPHGWANISSSDVTYLAIRVDPDRVLPAGLGEKSDRNPIKP